MIDHSTLKEEYITPRKTDKEESNMPYLESVLPQWDDGFLWQEGFGFGGGSRDSHG
jgi:hypothetical protein